MLESEPFLIRFVVNDSLFYIKVFPSQLIACIVKSSELGNKKPGNNRLQIVQMSSIATNKVICYITKRSNCLQFKEIVFKPSQSFPKIALGSQESNRRYRQQLNSCLEDEAVFT